MNIELIRQALRTAEYFIADELETRTRSFLPDPTEDESGYLAEAQRALDAARAALAELAEPGENDRAWTAARVFEISEKEWADLWPGLRRIFRDRSGKRSIENKMNPIGGNR